MTDVEKTELFAALAALARLYPHWRVGQLISNVAGWADTDIWNVEDNQLLSAIREHLGAAPSRESTHATGSTDSHSGGKLILG